MKKIFIMIMMLFGIISFSQTQNYENTNYENITYLYILYGNDIDSMLDADIEQFDGIDVEFIVHVKTDSIIMNLDVEKQFNFFIINKSYDDDMMTYECTDEENYTTMIVFIESDVEDEQLLYIIQKTNPITFIKFNYKKIK